MDDTTAALLARHQHRMQRINELYGRAEWKREDAAKIEQEVSLPDHLRPSGDQTLRSLEAKLLRQEADALEREAADIQGQLVQRPSEALNRQIDEWIVGGNPDRERGSRER